MSSLASFTNGNTFIDRFVALTSGGAFGLNVVAGGAQRAFLVKNSAISPTPPSVVHRITEKRDTSVNSSNMPCLAAHRWVVDEKGAASASLVGLETGSFTLSAAHMDGGVSTLVVTSGLDTYDSIAFCDFKWSPWHFEVLDVMVEPRLRGTGLGSVVQRLAYILAGNPRIIRIRGIDEKHPAYGELADRHLDSGVIRQFDSESFRGSVAKVFDVQVVGLHLLNDDEIGIKVTRRFELYHPDGTSFEVELIVDEEDV